ncbi:hypothetical protein [Clostridium perfringens]|uniref:hypothetical protein n=1 Tax=Clostridium perfringens TaxID=1502 RepID=UPI000BBAA0F6|nr:hypothetical protein [Clostridium perfringens]
MILIIYSPLFLEILNDGKYLDMKLYFKVKNEGNKYKNFFYAISFKNTIYKNDSIDVYTTIH